VSFQKSTTFYVATLTAVKSLESKRQADGRYLTTVERQNQSFLKGDVSAKDKLKEWSWCVG
jgi:hypothetical protein